jgi:hypothetical protein
MGKKKQDITANPGMFIWCTVMQESTARMLVRVGQPLQGTQLIVPNGSIVEIHNSNIIREGSTTHVAPGSLATLVYIPGQGGAQGHRPVVFLETAMPVSTIEKSIPTTDDNPKEPKSSKKKKLDTTKRKK